MRSKILIGSFLGILSVGLMWLLLGSISGTPEELVVAVRQGELDISVRATGKIESGNAVRVEAEGGARILTWLATEGEAVKKGDIIARFDDSVLREDLLGRQNDYKAAEVGLAQKRQQAEVRRQGLAAEVATLEADLAIKRSQYDRLKSLPRPEDLTRARLDRDYRKSLYELAKHDFETLRMLEARGSQAFSKDELREKELAYHTTKGDLEKAENALGETAKGALPADLDAAKRDLAKAENALAEAKTKLPEEFKMLEADVRSAEADLDKMKARVDKSQKDLDESEVKSPGDGILLYRTMWGRPLQLGDQFWRRAHLFDIADPDNMIVRVKVSESDYAHIAVGMSADVAVYSLPDAVYHGRVTEVAKVAKDKSEGEVVSWHDTMTKAGIQTFDVLISMETHDGLLMPNVEAAAVIHCKRIPNALSVPVYCVFSSEGRKWVRVLEGGEAVPREVKVGEQNSEWAEIREGLKPGERVLLKVPRREGKG